MQITARLIFFRIEKKSEKRPASPRPSPPGEGESPSILRVCAAAMFVSGHWREEGISR
jgi:hypothetical protein